MEKKPQVVERVAALAMQLGSRHLADYGANTSRHDFTQRQLVAYLILRAYTKTTYRGILEFLAVTSSVRKEMGCKMTCRITRRCRSSSREATCWKLPMP